jgi:hypothetical protein
MVLGFSMAVVGCGPDVVLFVGSGVIPPLLNGGGLPSVALLVLVGPGLLFALCVGLFGLYMIIPGVRLFIARAKVGAPEVAVSNTSPAVGEVITFTYRQTFKGAADAKRLQFQLVLLESAIHGSGKSMTMVRYEHIVQDFDEPARHFQGGETFQQQRQFQVPLQSMHTFGANKNSLLWFIRARVELAG